MRVTTIAVAALAPALSLLAPTSAYAASSPSPQASTVPATRHVIDPNVSFAKDCRTGITVILSNIAPDDSTTDPVTFSVTEPSGRTNDVTVQPNQLVKLVYAVADGATAAVAVDTAGLAHQAFTWTNRCTRVLGEKVTHAPVRHRAAPADPPTLAFTGVPTAPLAAVGAGLLIVGVGLLRAGRRRVRRA
jgi:hypothetical protein